MSYILEALKKAEQSRLSVKLPDITTVTFSSEAPDRPRTAWLYSATFAGVVACAAAFGWWLSSKPQDRPTPDKVAAALPDKEYPAVTEPTREPAGMSLKLATDLPHSVEPKRNNINVSPQASVSRQPLPVASSVQPRTALPAESAKPVLATKPVVAGQQAPERKPEGAAGLAESLATGKVALLGSKAKASAPGSAVAEVDKPPLAVAPLTGLPKASLPLASVPQAKPSPSARVWRLDELPLEIRRDLPKLGITGYVYSADPAGRVVSINERSLREGDELIAGLKLEQIAQDYVLFSFRGYRFRSDPF
jgi:general secretion pathway protein B